jgi:hypothetical protein
MSHYVGCAVPVNLLLFLRIKIDNPNSKPPSSHCWSSISYHKGKYIIHVLFLYFNELKSFEISYLLILHRNEGTQTYNNEIFYNYIWPYWKLKNIRRKS